MYWSWFVITKRKSEKIYWDERVRILRFLNESWPESVPVEPVKYSYNSFLQFNNFIAVARIAPKDNSIVHKWIKIGIINHYQFILWLCFNILRAYYAVLSFGINISIWVFHVNALYKVKPSMEHGKIKAELLIYTAIQYLQTDRHWIPLSLIDQYPPWEGSLAFWLKLFLVFCWDETKLKKKENYSHIHLYSVVAHLHFPQIQLGSV